MAASLATSCQLEIDCASLSSRSNQFAIVGITRRMELKVKAGVSLWMCARSMRSMEQHVALRMGRAKKVASCHCVFRHNLASGKSPMSLYWVSYPVVLTCLV